MSLTDTDYFAWLSITYINSKPLNSVNSDQFPLSSKPIKCTVLVQKKIFHKLNDSILSLSQVELTLDLLINTSHV